MRGRKPKPTHLKLISGNPGKRPIRMDEFRPEARIPRCPAHLNGEAKREWLRVSKLLLQHCMVTDVDRGALAMLCTLWDRYVTAELMIDKAKEAAPASAGLFVKSPNGFPIQSPWLAVSNRAIEQYKSMCNEFGLTPAARVRVVPTATQPSLFDVNEDKPDGFGAI
jgi:P27 family predicted phage terminase small subunit